MALLGGLPSGETEGAAVADDGDLGKPLVLHQLYHWHRVAGLVIGEAAALVERHVADGFAEAELVVLAGAGDVVVGDGVAAIEVGVDDGLVDEVLDGDGGVPDGIIGEAVEGHFLVTDLG